MSSFHAFLIALSLALGLACAQPAFAQGSTTPPGGPFTPPDAFPDLVVTSVKGSAVCTPQGTITATIEATVKNQGKTTADLTNITWQIILSGSWAAISDDNSKYLEKYPPPQTVTPYIGSPKKLAYNDSWTGNMTIAGITKYKTIKGNTQPGIYSLQANADPYNKIVESNEKNNYALTSVKDPCFKAAR